MEVNEMLYTKDGRVFGNSIILKKYKSESQKKLDLYDIKTDCGRVVEGLTARYIRYCFYVIKIHKIKCDGCGELKLKSELFQVYDENFNKQKGVFECSECKGL